MSEIDRRLADGDYVGATRAFEAQSAAVPLVRAAGVWWEILTTDSSGHPTSLRRRELDGPARVECRMMSTRRCPAAFEGGCGDRLCARFESDSEEPWIEEL